MIRAPWLWSEGVRAKGFVELIDVLPTGAELAEITPPPYYNESHIDGSSLLPLMSDPGSVGGTAYSQHPRAIVNISSSTSGGGEPTLQSVSTSNLPPVYFSHMGYTLRTKGWRYSEWYTWDPNTLTPDWANGLVEQELHRHPEDFFEDSGYP